MGAGLAAARSKMSRLLLLLKQRKGSRQPHNSDKAHGRTNDGRCGQKQAWHHYKDRQALRRLGR